MSLTAFIFTQLFVGLDKGGADLIASGAIKIKQGVSPTSFAPDGLVFSDGSHLRADVVIFA